MANLLRSQYRNAHSARLSSLPAPKTSSPKISMSRPFVDATELPVVDVITAIEQRADRVSDDSVVLQQELLRFVSSASPTWPVATRHDASPDAFIQTRSFAAAENTQRRHHRIGVRAVHLFRRALSRQWGKTT